MLKRKLGTNVDNLLNAKKKAKEGKLDILFDSADKIRPTDVSECLSYIQGLVDWRKFCGKSKQYTYFLLYFDVA